MSQDATIHLNAIALLSQLENWKRKNDKQRAKDCFSLFSFCHHYNYYSEDKTDADFINLVATTFDSEYLSTIEDFFNVKEKGAIESLKGNILLGLYLWIWSKYNTVVNRFLYPEFCALLKEHLISHLKDVLAKDDSELDKIEVLLDVVTINKELYQQSLNDLTTYTSYIFKMATKKQNIEGLEKSMFERINEYFGTNAVPDLMYLSELKPRSSDASHTSEYVDNVKSFLGI